MPEAPHVIDLTDGWCDTHDAYCDVDYEADEYIIDPIDEPMEWDGELRAGETALCRLCRMPVARTGGRWGHTRQGLPPGGPHHALPEVRHG